MHMLNFIIYGMYISHKTFTLTTLDFWHLCRLIHHVSKDSSKKKSYIRLRTESFQMDFKMLIRGL